MTPEEVARIEKAERVRMPWGKYRGKRIGETPSSYLRWLAECCNDAVIAEAADVVWRWREENDDHIEEGE